MLRPFVRTAITLFILSWFFPLISVANWSTLIIASLVLTVLYVLIRPILKLLFLPINVITLGLFSSVINIFLLWFTTYLVPGFEIRAVILLGIPLSSLATLVVVSFFIGSLQSLLHILL